MSTKKPPSDWKDKYFTALEKEEKRKNQSQQMVALLTRAVVRISLVADGLDTRLDQQLTGLRKMLSEGSIGGSKLKMLVDALEGHVKRLDKVKIERSKTTLTAYHSLVSQLKSLKPSNNFKKKLVQFEKTLKKRSAHIQEYSLLIDEFSQLQKKVLASVGQPVESKPFWHSWHRVQKTETSPPAKKESPKSEDIEVIIAEEVDESLEEYGGVISGKSKTDKAGSIVVEQVNDGLDLSDNVQEPRIERKAEQFSEEPTYSRLNQHLKDVLSELLDQIEPPSLAQENYLAARKQIDAGLPWYELIPTLEDISLVVITAFDSRQKEFEQYLEKINKRLAQAYKFISTSKKVHGEGAAAARLFDASMREDMSAMRLGVDNATELDQLKMEVNFRLDKIVMAMDQNQIGEKEREQSLSEQLNALVGRVKEMESDSKDAEKRVEEQRQRALRDVLTQLPNREAYQIRIQQEYERWKRYDRPLALVVCDIDFFKRVNDGYGHLAGDKVLRIIAKTLSKRLRETDFIARYGGEEFVMLMPETNQDQSLKVTEGIREAIANCPFHFKEEKLSITMSFGVTEFSKEDSPEAAFARADKALYAAKEGGRNCCQLAEIVEGGKKVK